MDVEANQSRGNQAEVAQHRVPTADVWPVPEYAPESGLTGKFVQRRACVSDGYEPVSRALGANSVLHDASEEPVQHIRLDRGAGLGRDEEQRASGVDGLRDARNASGNRGVEHDQIGPAFSLFEGLPQHLRAQAAAAHSEQDDVSRSLVADFACELIEVIQTVQHRGRDFQPAQPVGDLSGIGRP